MTAKVKGISHVIVGMTGVTAIVAMLPHPYNIVFGAIWTGLVALSAFLDQSLSQ